LIVQALPDHRALAPLIVLRDEKTQKLVSNFWGSVQQGGFSFAGGAEE
jgi:hypothetical protein